MIGGAAGRKMKGTSGWDSSGNGTNKSGLARLPDGCRTQWSFAEIGE